MMNFLGISKSNLRRKILSYFFTNPDSNLYLREIANIINEDPGNLSRELSRLENEGIFKSIKRGNQKYFYLNKEYPLYKELKSIVFKTIGIKGGIKKIFEKIGDVKLVFIYGSYAKSKENYLSDVDLIIIGSPDEDKLIIELDRLENQLKREINYKIYTMSEIKKEIKEKEPFILEILKDKKIIVIGDEHELQKIAEG
ncbi:MAG: nucleotidyltransferase domain-containing protein [Actinobacteria bacterium]|nr:nucleotidyltransferase domain-containing protein [Actinomycetota bacterium]